jgi:hypothetical protein
MSSMPTNPFGPTNVQQDFNNLTTTANNSRTISLNAESQPGTPIPPPVTQNQLMPPLTQGANALRKCLQKW